LLTGHCSWPTGARDHAKTCETTEFIAPIAWPVNSPDSQPSRLPDLREAAGACVLQLDHEYDVAQLKLCLIKEWKHFNQMITDEAVGQ